MENFDLDKPLIEFSDNKGTSNFTIRNAVEGVQIFGGIGSGKTSGSGHFLALKYLSNGFGGLVLTAKPDEKEMWQEYCRQTGRLHELVIMEPRGKNFFNFLEYECSAEGNSLTENIVQVLKTVIKAGEEKSHGRSDDQFWEAALDTLLFNAIDLCLLAYNKVSLQLLYDIVISIPQKQESGTKSADFKNVNTAFGRAFKLASKEVTDKVDAWEESLSKEYATELKNSAQFEEKVCEQFPEARLLKTLDQFFVETHYTLNQKTRSIIEMSFSGFLFRLLREPIYSLFCNLSSSVTPQDSIDGKIILLNLPVKQYHKVGRDVQLMFKYIWQRAMEKRNVKENARPVFLFADEAQNFLHEHDADFQATARSSRIATVYLTQNLPNYYASMGGERSQHKVASLLATLNTKFFHANADIDTNSYASQLIGQAWTKDESKSFSFGDSFSMGGSEGYKLEFMVRPEEFLKLKTGGPLNNYNVQAYMHRMGEPFHTGFNHRLIQFTQHLHH